MNPESQNWFRFPQRPSILLYIRSSRFTIRSSSTRRKEQLLLSCLFIIRQTLVVRRRKKKIRRFCTEKKETNKKSGLLTISREGWSFSKNKLERKEREEKGEKVLKDFERWSPRPANFVVPFFPSFSSPSCFCCRRCFRFESYSFLTDIRQVCNFRVYWIWNDGKFRMYIDDKSNESNLIKFSLTLLNVST